MTTNNLPKCLRHKLIFGDKEQIEALQKIDREIQEQEERAGELPEGILKKFDVGVWFSGYTKVRVWAKDKHHAECIAEKMDIEPDSVTIDETEAEEIKP